MLSVVDARAFIMNKLIVKIRLKKTGIKGLSFNGTGKKIIIKVII